jgi:plastocyanin
VAVAAVAIGFALVGLRKELAAAGPTAQASGTATVDINHFAYHPPTLTIAAGSSVAFSNTSRVTHTATRNGSFTTGRIKPGGSVVVRFTRRGVYSYHCQIHPFMHGKIVVR